MSLCLHFFFFNDTATTEIYTLSLHDALPIYGTPAWCADDQHAALGGRFQINIVHAHARPAHRDRKSTRLNSSHGYISYAVFCLKKKKKTQQRRRLSASPAPQSYRPHWPDRHD